MEYRIWIESAPVDHDKWDAYAEELTDRLAAILPEAGVVGWGRPGDTLGAVFNFDAYEPGVDPQGHAGAVGEALLTFFQQLQDLVGYGEAAIDRYEVTPADYEPVTFVGASDIAKILDVSRQRVYQLMMRKDFPMPAAKLARGSVWDRRAIVAFGEKERRGGRPAGKRQPVG